MQEYALQAKGLTKTYKAVGPTAGQTSLERH